MLWKIQLEPSLENANNHCNMIKCFRQTSVFKCAEVDLGKLHFHS